MWRKAQKHVHVHLVEEKLVTQKHVHVEEKYVKQKYHPFASEPMGEKPVTELPGVGEALGKRLVTAGFDKAYVVLGQFLVLKKNQQSFKEWMKDTCSASTKQSLHCWQCLNDWCEEFL